MHNTNNQTVLVISVIHFGVHVCPYLIQWAYNDFCRIAPSAKASSELIITMKKSKFNICMHDPLLSRRGGEGRVL